MTRSTGHPPPGFPGRPASEAPDARGYRHFADLAQAQVRGRDYDISVLRRPASPVAVIAPHGGRIEDGTSDIARAIAGDDFNLYLLEGLRPSLNYHALHLTSHRFDEPECLDLIGGCHVVIAIHGCDGAGDRIYLGGLDSPLRDHLAGALSAADFVSETTGHRYPATHPENICNRGARRRGVQLELTHPLRRSPRGLRVAALVRRAVLDFVAAPG